MTEAEEAKHKADLDKKATQRRKEQIEERLELFWDKRGKRYESCTLDNFKAETDSQRNAVTETRSYIKNIYKHVENGVSLVFYGPPGTGKDHLLAVVMRAAIERGAYVTWHSGGRLFVALRHEMNNGGSEGEWIDRFVRPTILALSDPVPPIGSLEKYRSEMFHTAIDERYSDLKPIWVTLNATGGDEAKQRLTEPILDRLKHNAIVVPCDWESHRKPKGLEV